MSTLISILVLIGLLWLGLFWYRAMQMREIALSESKKYCKQQDWQFLDESVVCKGIKFRRDSFGHLRISRTYQFEYYDGELKRKVSIISVCGNEVTEIGVHSQNNIIEIKHFRRDHDYE